MFLSSNNSKEDFFYISFHNVSLIGVGLCKTIALRAFFLFPLAAETLLKVKAWRWDVMFNKHLDIHDKLLSHSLKTD